jgi:hypothetical protein
VNIRRIQRKRQASFSAVDFNSKRIATGNKRRYT